MKLDHPIDFAKHPQLRRATIASLVDVPLLDSCFILGWGGNGTVYSDILQVARYRLLSPDLCQKAESTFNQLISLCGDGGSGTMRTAGAGGFGDPRACSGDDGRPLMCISKWDQDVEPFKLFGVISHSKEKCDSAQWNPTFFSSVTYYNGWIRWVMRNN